MVSSMLGPTTAGHAQPEDEVLHMDPHLCGSLRHALTLWRVHPPRHATSDRVL